MPLLIAPFSWRQAAYASGMSENAFVKLGRRPNVSRSVAYISATASLARSSGVVSMNVMQLLSVVRLRDGESLTSYRRLVRDYYEDLWQRLPDELAPPDFERRRRFLLGNLRQGERVLDLGCGTGEFTASLAAAGAAPIGVEVSHAALERARSRHPDLDIRLAPTDGPLPLKDCSFDLVWATEVIEHVADTACGLCETRS